MKKFNENTRNEIINGRYNEHKSVTELSKEYGVSVRNIVAAIFPKEFKTGDQIRCEVCGEWYNPVCGGRSYTLTCSRECAGRLKSMKAANIWSISAPTEIKREQPVLVEDDYIITEEYDETTGEWIKIKKPNIYKKFAKYDLKNYGKEMASIECDKAEKAEMTHQAWIDVCNYNYKKTSHMEYEYKGE